MTSEKQQKANRENSRKSTGPKSSKGKAIVSTNAIRHGLLSNIMVIRDKTMEEFEGFSQALIKSIQPEGALEQLLAAKVIQLAWRLQRVLSIESEMLSGRCGYSRLDSPAECFSPPYDVRLQNVSRYESMLERNFYRALQELQRLQSRRSTCAGLGDLLGTFGLA